ncbi:exonuclease mut-7 homolog [Condylostylus longicornis]|uniref:exonuclease mut-7 homolog n=1 Tax=Condylostylus longicornis TaxID=2530218 RepID=UPI00244DDDE9|nr:exonuclease mut-7 homolog [Condylostylus longicornis]
MGTRFLPAGMEDEEDDDIYDFYCPGANALTKTLQNMCVTVVPDLTKGADLNDKDFDASLCEEINNWFETFKKQWALYKKTPAIKQALEDLFILNENPLLLALKIFANSPGCNNLKTKNNLAYFVLVTVCNLKKMKPHISEKCTDNMKMVAFNFIKTQGIPILYKAVRDAYELTKAKELFVEKIRELVKNRYYKDASHWALYLDLTNRFTLYDIPLPLIMQDKISIAEEYLDKAKHLQRDIVEILDSFLNPNSSVTNECDKIISEYKYNDVRYEKLQSKPLTKLIVRLAKKYNIPQESVPNVNRQKNYGCLQYLIHKRYIEKGMSNDAWRELVTELLANSKDLELDLIYAIWFNGDTKETLYWLKVFRIPIDRLPFALQENLADGIKTSADDDSWNGQMKFFSTKRSVVGEEPGTSRKQFYTLNLRKENIIYVDRPESFEAMLKRLRSESLIAFDAEFKPSFKGEAMLNLIQIAAKDTVYLIDVLSNELKGNMWSKLGENVFCNNEILKLGFCLQQDLAMLEKDLPMLNINIQNSCAYLDIQILWRNVNKIMSFKFPYKVEKPGQNLSALVELCFGKKLDKSNQCSNWSNRPLRTEQINYAALDAFCLIEIYNTIKEIFERQPYCFDSFVEDIISESKSKTQKFKKKAVPIKVSKTESNITEDSETPSPFSMKTTTKDVKFICDEMLAGLCKGLRKYGVDCLVVAGLEVPEDICIKVALKENRFVLTKGERFVKYSQYLPYGHCFKLYSNDVEDQILEVLKYYNVVLSKKDIFSRCQICNSNEFILLNTYDMKRLINGNYSKTDNIKKPTESPPQRNFILNVPSSKTFFSKTTNQNKKIQLSKIPDHVIDLNYYFYICEGCGKCYWDGSHLEKVLNGPAKKFIEDRN